MAKKEIYEDYKQASPDQHGRNKGLGLIERERNRELQELKNLDLMIHDGQQQERPSQDKRPHGFADSVHNLKKMPAPEQEEAQNGRQPHHENHLQPAPGNQQRYREQRQPSPAESSASHSLASSRNEVKGPGDDVGKKTPSYHNMFKGRNQGRW